MQLIKKHLTASIAMLSMAAGISNASTFIIDQQNDGLAPFQGYTTAFGTMGQSFSPTFNFLDHVELQLNAQGPTPAIVHVDIMDSPTGTVLGSSNSLSFTGTTVQLGHFEFVPIDISSYSNLFISIVQDGAGTAGAFLAGGFGANTYAGGAAYLADAPCCDGFQPESDLWFRTGVVPVPAAVWLFGSGLIGIVALARRKV